MRPFSSGLLDGKRILITGGGSGLGRGVARHLVDHGADFVLGRLNQSEAQILGRKLDSVKIS